MRACGVALLVLAGCGGSPPAPLPSGTMLVEDFCPASMPGYMRCYVTKKADNGY